MSSTYVSAADAAGIVLENAATNQREGQTIANASTAIVCTGIIAMAFAGTAAGKLMKKNIDTKQLKKIEKLGKQS